MMLPLSGRRDHAVADRERADGVDRRLERLGHHAFVAARDLRLEVGVGGRRVAGDEARHREGRRELTEQREPLAGRVGSSV